MMMNHDKPLDRGITNPYTYVYIYIYLYIYLYALKYAPLVDGNLRGVEQLN